MEVLEVVRAAAGAVPVVAVDETAEETAEMEVVVEPQ